MLQMKLRMLEAYNHVGRQKFVSNHFASEPRREPNDLKVFKFLKPSKVFRHNKSLIESGSYTHLSLLKRRRAAPRRYHVIAVL